MNIKIKTGYGENDFKLIDMQEAHKAYYLFLNPTTRTVFSDGIAMTGQSIISIEPDYHSIMGYNRTHKLNDEDWNDIRASGLVDIFKDNLEIAKDIAYQIGEHNKHLLNQKLDDVKISIELLQNNNSKLLN